jgi:hypothetical protein
MRHDINETPDGARCSCGREFTAVAREQAMTAAGRPLQGAINLARSNAYRHRDAKAPR